MLHYNTRTTDRRQPATAHALALRSFLVDIALYAVAMILFAVFAGSAVPLVLAVVMVGFGVLHVSKTATNNTDDQPRV